MGKQASVEFLRVIDSIAHDRSVQARCRVEQEKGNSISTINYVLFFLSYKHNSSLLTRNANFINQ